DAPNAATPAAPNPASPRPSCSHSARLSRADLARLRSPELACFVAASPTPLRSLTNPCTDALACARSARIRRTSDRSATTNLLYQGKAGVLFDAWTGRRPAIALT